MKKYLFLICCLLPLFSYAWEEDGFISYRRPLAPWVSLVQTDDTTSILYRRQVIKTYQNKEFATELLPHGPNEDPDCYNSLVKNTPSSRAKNIIGKEYLRSCLILKSDLFRGKYILFYAPSIEGNRVSIYDIKAKKFYPFIINTALSVSLASDRSLVFLLSNRQSPCERSIVSFRNGATKKLYDDCRLMNSAFPSISIQKFQIIESSVEISYFPYTTVGLDIILDTVHTEKITLPLPSLTPPVVLPRPQTMTWLLIPPLR